MFYLYSDSLRWFIIHVTITGNHQLEMIDLPRDD